MACNPFSYMQDAAYVTARTVWLNATANYHAVNANCYKFRQAARDACVVARTAYRSNPTLPGLQVAYRSARDLRDTVAVSSFAASELAFAQLDEARDAMETARIAYHTAV